MSLLARIPLLIGGALSVPALVVVIPAAAAGAAANDYGDAPDGKPAGYITQHNATGHFPALEASDGARHSAPGPLRLGRAVNAEADSKQVNLDEFDDGFAVNFPSPCRTGTVTFLVDASRLPASSLTAGHIGYLNAWFDWTQDGDWGDSDRCAPEWRVQNFPIDMASFAGNPIQAIQVQVPAGAQVQEYWSRATLTLDEPVVSPVGKGQFTNGETEDYLTRRLGGRFLNVRCKPQFNFGYHGRAIRGGFVVKKKNPGPLRIRLRNRGLPPGIAVNFNRLGYIVRSRKDPPRRFQGLTLRFRFDDTKGATSLIKCWVLIFHNGDDRLKRPRKLPKPPPLPPRKDCPRGFIRASDNRYTTVSVQGNNCGRAIKVLSFPLSQLATPVDRVGIHEVDNPLTRDQRKWACALKAANGGLPDVACTSDPPVPPGSFFDVFFTLDISPLPSLGADLNGTTASDTSADASFGISPSK